MRTNPVVRVLSLTIVLAILTGLPALHAQFTTASLGGNVLDASGAAVPGAKVAISNKDTGLKQETSTDAAGAFLFSTLPVGNYQLDGAGHNDTYINTNLPFPNPDSVQEFSLQADNLTAEYGNAVGGVVNIVTKSGTNQLHGSAFEFLRNGAVNARNYFAPKHDELKRNQFGASAGGPILKDKLFFFGTYQGTRIRNAP